jgi:CRP/FNR family transcriptional regulator, cyclic AMP receptor protein
MSTTEPNNLECPLFQEMTPEESRLILELFEHESFPQGEEILEEGLTTQMLWIIVRGQCEVGKSNGNGEHRTLAQLEQGAVFGEMSFFKAEPHSASVRALTDVKVMKLSREKFDQLREQSPIVAYKIASNTAIVLAERLRRMDDWTAELFNKPNANPRQKEEWHEFRAKLYTEWEF